MPGVPAIRLPPPDFTAAHVRELTKRILSEAQFHQPAKPWLTRLSDWLSKEIAKLLDTLASGSDAGFIAWVIVGVAVAAAVLLLRRFTRRIRRDPGIAVQHTITPKRSAADWNALAAAHRQAGEWREAVRCGYRAMVATLAERGVVDDVPGRTAREYEQLINRNLPGATGAFGDATDLFEAVWYGDRETGAEEEQSLRRLREKVLEAAGRR